MNIGIFWMCNVKLSLDGEGIGRFSLRLAEGLLQQENVNVIVLTEHGNMPEIVSLFSVVKEKYPSRLALVAAQHMEWVNANLPVDIWVIPYPASPLAYNLNKPFILCLHDLSYIHFPEEPRDQRIQLLDFSARALALRTACAVFSSAFIRNNEGLAYLNLPAERTRVIRLAPPVEEYNAFGYVEEASFRARYNLHFPYLVFPSAIRHYKNHTRLIEAFLRYRQNEPDSPLNLLITDNPAQYNRCHELLAAAERSPNIQDRHLILFTQNRLPSEHLPSLYRYALGTIVPTLFEGSCPFPILESLNEGTPVAVSDIPVTRELIGCMDDFIAFNPFSIEEMTCAISRLVAGHANPARQQAVLSAVLVRTWRDVGAEYLALCRQILAQQGERS